MTSSDVVRLDLFLTQVVKRSFAVWCRFSFIVQCQILPVDGLRTLNARILHDQAQLCFHYIALSNSFILLCDVE